MNNNDVKKVKVTFEYSNPNTSSIVSIFFAIFGIVFVISLIILSIIWM